MTKLESIFPESNDLKAIIESYNWSLYDLSNPKKRGAYTWEEINKMTPAKEFEVGHNYFFIPIPRNGETLKEAYSLTKGLGPSLFVEDENDSSKWFGLYAATSCYQEKKPILFTRLGFSPEFLLAFTPKSMVIPDSDRLGICYPTAIDTFRKNFRIVSPEEYGVQTPVPNPIIKGRMN
jgi:hypothetical protein